MRDATMMPLTLKIAELPVLPFHAFFSTSSSLRPYSLPASILSIRTVNVAEDYEIMTSTPQIPTIPNPQIHNPHLPIIHSCVLFAFNLTCAPFPIAYRILILIQYFVLVRFGIIYSTYSRVPYRGTHGCPFDPCRRIQHLCPLSCLAIHYSDRKGTRREPQKGPDPELNRVICLVAFHPRTLSRLFDSLPEKHGQLPP